MSGDALAAGGIVKINTDLLRDFASMNLQAFLDDVKASPAVRNLALFADGGAGGQSPSGSFSEVLAGNVDKGQLASAEKLKADFHTFATLVDSGVGDLQKLAVQMQTDLNMVASVVQGANDDADITAAEMSADLDNLGQGSGSVSSAGSGSATGGGSTTTTTTGKV